MCPVQPIWLRCLPSFLPSFVRHVRIIPAEERLKDVRSAIRGRCKNDSKKSQKRKLKNNYNCVTVIMCTTHVVYSIVRGHCTQVSAHSTTQLTALTRLFARADTNGSNIEDAVNISLIQTPRKEAVKRMDWVRYGTPYPQFNPPRCVNQELSTVNHRVKIIAYSSRYR